MPSSSSLKSCRILSDSRWLELQTAYQYVPVMGHSASNDLRAHGTKAEEGPRCCAEGGGQELKHSKGRCFESTERREEIMVMLKISSFLAVYALVVCQMDSFQAAPVRPGLESITDRVTLSDYEARRLLNALVKEFIQMTAEELEQASEGNSLDRPISKRCASLSTCVLGKLSQELHKLQTYPRTDVGAGTPGKKRNVLSDLEHERYANYGEPLGNN